MFNANIYAKQPRQSSNAKLNEKQTKKLFHAAFLGENSSFAKQFDERYENAQLCSNHLQMRKQNGTSNKPRNESCWWSLVTVEIWMLTMIYIICKSSFFFPLLGILS